jgi:hypothetical protein
LFDNKHGRALLFGGTACMCEMKTAVEDADSFIRTKLQVLENKGYDMNSLYLPTFE